MSTAEDSFDDPVGDAIALAAPDLLAAKAQQPIGRMIVLAVVAGAFIAFGSVIALVAQSGMGDGGATKLLSGAAFSVGLIMVMVTGAELFTGNTMMVLPTFTGKLGAGRMVSAWATVWLGNLIGSVAIVALFHAAGGLADSVGVAAVGLMQDKLDKSPGQVFSSAILANMLVCLAVWMSMAARSIPAKVLAVIGPVTIFVAAGLEHSIANMSILPLGWLADATEAADIAGGIVNIAVSTAGNIVGGAFVALAIAYGHGALHKSG